jgi:hypothetical protein
VIRTTGRWWWRVVWRGQTDLLGLRQGAYASRVPSPGVVLAGGVRAFGCGRWPRRAGRGPRPLPSPCISICDARGCPRHHRHQRVILRGTHPRVVCGPVRHDRHRRQWTPVTGARSSDPATAQPPLTAGPPTFDPDWAWIAMHRGSHWLVVGPHAGIHNNLGLARDLPEAMPHSATCSITRPRPARAVELRRRGATHRRLRVRVGPAFPSHGRSHRFDPCHAHHATMQVSVLP